MLGIVSLLDETHEALVQQIWDELEAEFNVCGIQITPYPHFSYHVARGYHPELAGALERLAQAAAPFQVQAGGIGIFTGDTPVIYIPVTRGPALHAFHQRVWSAVEPLSVGSIGYYTPEHWVPHITIGFGDITPDNLPPIVGWLNERAPDWHLPVTNLSLIANADRPEVEHLYFRLGGG